METVAYREVDTKALCNAAQPGVFLPEAAKARIKCGSFLMVSFIVGFGALPVILFFCFMRDKSIPLED